MDIRQASMSEKRRRTAPPGGRIGYFDGADGARLRYGLWSAGDEARGTVVFLNGRSEFIEKHFETYTDLAERGYSVATFDWRGQGLSGRASKNPHKDHQTDFSWRRADLDLFLRKVVKAKCAPPYYAIGHSLGAHMLFHHLHDRPGFFERVVALAPMVGIALEPLPSWVMGAYFGVVCALGFGARYAPGQGDYDERRKSPERAAYLTSNMDRFKDEDAAITLNPDLALGGVTYAWLRAARRSTARLEAPGFAEAIETPCLILMAGADRLVENARIEAFAARLPHAECAVIEGARHELLKERDELRQATFGHIMRYLKRGGSE